MSDGNSIQSGRSDQFDRIHNSFLKMESELNLFDWEINETPVWERIRFPIYQRIMRGSDVFQQAHPEMEKDAKDYLTGGWLWFKNIFIKNPLFSSNHDILFWSHPRRRLREDGSWCDIITDPLIESNDFDYVTIEEDYNLDHRTPARTRNLRYLDLITFSSTIYRKLSPKPQCDNYSKIVSNHLVENFSVDVDVERLVYEKMTDRRVYLPIYKLLLTRVDPSVAVIVTSYGKETFVEACREIGIPVVELQHGTISRFHVGYSYPGKRTKRDAPDYFFSFGPFWHDKVPLPIPEQNIYDIGYSFLENEVSNSPDRNKSGEIIFISQGSIASELSKLAVSVARSDQIQNQVVYKLHPGELDRWRECYPWLIEADVTVVEEDPSLYDLLSRADFQVGVYSTAVFEGIRFGQKTILVDLPGIQYMSDFIAKYDIPVVSDIHEFTQEIYNIEAQKVNPNEFFTPNPDRNFANAIVDISERH